MGVWNPGLWSLVCFELEFSADWHRVEHAFFDAWKERPLLAFVVVVEPVDDKENYWEKKEEFDNRILRPPKATLFRDFRA